MPDVGNTTPLSPPLRRKDPCLDDRHNCARALVFRLNARGAAGWAGDSDLAASAPGPVVLAPGTGSPRRPPGTKWRLPPALGVPTVSVVAFSFARANLVVSGLEVLIDPQSPIVLPITSAASMTIPLAVPSAASFANVTFQVQSFHIDGGGLASSPGLTIGLIAP